MSSPMTPGASRRQTARVSVSAFSAHRVAVATSAMTFTQASRVRGRR
jgi:hypothetical protein